MANIFDTVKISRPKSSTFDLSHDVKLSLDMGRLVPIMCMETVPGDRISIASESLLRFQPLVSPVMHRMDVTIHYFFCPNRLLWPNWENFITNTKIEGDVLPAFPYFTLDDNTTNVELLDYLGVPPPPTGATPTNISALPVAAYNKIYNEYYRDQNLITPMPDTVDDGYNDVEEFAFVQKRAWEHDYFTAALPFAQKGDAVSIPLGTVELDKDSTGRQKLWNEQSGGYFGTGDVTSDTTNGGLSVDLGAGNIAASLDPDGTLVVEPTTINDLRQAFSLQKWLEKMARGGSRYIEVIKSHFNVRSSDARLQRPEYITGTKSPVVISEVLNTTGTAEAAQGTMAGHAISVGNGNRGSFYCEEHGYIIGIMSVLPKPAYMQGIPKHFLKDDPLEFAWPDFAHLGEQPVQNKELFAYTVTGHDTFGYVPRYAEYKFEPSRVAGDFRTTLDFWHLARKFATQPALNQLFIEMDSTAADRVFAVEDPEEQKLLCHVYNKVKAVRPLPKFGTPTF